jgi:hypothetical protein
MTVRVVVELTNEQAEVLFREAYLTHGLLREEPKKRWTDGERRQFIRYAIDKRMPA